jgi:hypothetical protein
MKNTDIEREADHAYDLSSKIVTVLHGHTPAMCAAAFAAALGRICVGIDPAQRLRYLTEIVSTAEACADTLDRFPQ